MQLVLLPGMDGTANLFAPLIAQLGDGFSITCISYPPDQALGYAALTALVQQQLPASGSYVLLGESFSGPIAVALAAQGHAQLAGLILCCTFIKNPRPALARFKSLVDMAPFSAPPSFVLNYLLLGAFATPALSQALRNAVQQVAPQVMKCRLNAVMAVDMAAQMAAITVPTLYLRAAHDRLVPRAASQRVCDANSLVKVLEIDAPHGLLQAAPQAAAAAIHGFVRSI
jgi:pimeloyl-ACP methyl ester carboxylesterase